MRAGRQEQPAERPALGNLLRQGLNHQIPAKHKVNIL